MSKFGFKVFTATLHRKEINEQLNFSVEGVNVLEIFCKEVASIIESRESGEHSDSITSELPANALPITIDDDLFTDMSELGISQHKVMRFQRALQLEQGLLLEVDYGIVGDHTFGVDPAGKQQDIDIRDLATVRSYRVVVIANPLSSNAVIAYEVISRTHVATHFPDRLHRASSGHNLTLKNGKIAADVEAVNQMIRNSNISAVELTKIIPSNDSVVARSRTARLVIPIGKNSSLLEITRNYLTKWLSSSNLNTTDEATSLATILWEDVVDLGFDDARIRIEKDGRSRSISPSDIGEGFTYDIGPNKPSDEILLAHIDEVVARIDLSLSLNVSRNWYVVHSTIS